MSARYNFQDGLAAYARKQQWSPPESEEARRHNRCLSLIGSLVHDATELPPWRREAVAQRMAEAAAVLFEGAA